MANCLLRKVGGGYIFSSSLAHMNYFHEKSGMN